MHEKQVKKNLSPIHRSKMRSLQMHLKIIHICDCTKLFGRGEFQRVGTAIIKAVTNRANS